MAKHYGAVVIPARVRKPKDKAPVEKEVQDVARWIIAKLRNQTFFSLYELKQAVKKLLEEANNRTFQDAGLIARARAAVKSPISKSPILTTITCRSLSDLPKVESTV